jgi:nitrite reductase/ring-hydroxylating ferredoxin subunit
MDDITQAPDGRPAEAQPAWRHDFPIDAAADQYLWRRDFMKFLVLTSLAFTSGQFWIAANDWWRSRRTVPPGQPIALVSDLAVGGALKFQFPTEVDPCLLLRPGQDEFVAFSQKCTHLSCAVIPEPSENRLRCPCHEGIFDARTGRPIAGPPRRPLPEIQLQVRDGVVYATGVITRTV